MAILTIPAERRRLDDAIAVSAHLATLGVTYERWPPAHTLPPSAAASEVLLAYHEEIERLKASGGYVSADVIDVKASTPGLDEMLAKFRREHWHDEDEVRFIIAGRGVFHLRPRDGAVAAIEVEPGDLLRVPAGTWHWFDLCPDRAIRAIRLFQDPAGWTPRYTGSGVDAGYEPVCLGAKQIPRANVAGI